MRIAREKARRMSRKELVDQLARRLAEIHDLQHEAGLLARELDLNQRVWRAHAQAVAACRVIVEALQALAIPIATLHQDPANARRHGDKNLDAIKSSLAKFGQRKPIVVQREGMIVRAGNGTLAAAKALGWNEIAAVVLDEDNASASQFAIADNRSAELAEWDDEVLASLLDGLDKQAQHALGFDDKDLGKLMAGLTPDVTQDDVPEAPEVPVTKPGDLITLGRHRLVCGDSADAESRKRVLNGRRADMVFTDPPYGVNVSGAGGKAIAGDLTSTALPLFFADLESVLADDAWAYVCGGSANLLTYAKLWERHFRQLPKIIVWDKENIILRHNGYHSQYELVFAGWRGNCGDRWFGGRSQEEASDIWRCRVEHGAERVHICQKPVAIPLRAIANSCPSGGLVWEPFCGSGSTLIACEQAGRECAAIELDPAYCDVIVKRWEQLTGQKAVR